MLLRFTYSNTKRLLKRTIESFKSYFPGGYQRLPKIPPCNPFSCTGSRGGARPRTTHFTHSTRESEITTNHPKNPAATRKETSSLKVKDANLVVDHYEVDSKKQDIKMDCGSHVKDEEESSKSLVTRKLKELEMMDRNNIDLVFDIEEVLHYYSRLTCPIYRDIIEKFFVEMYSGTFNLSHVR
ncbi:hypothetical protein L1887_03269 [Cichorium endivia]|nr:hypothetical protein L1887_03269 [Cichorium endivia]